MTAVVFLHLKKGLDSVDHDILFSKLQNCDIQSPTKQLGISSYLKNRTQTYVINCTKSGPKGSFSIVLQKEVSWGLFCS